MKVTINDDVKKIGVKLVGVEITDIENSKYSDTYRKEHTDRIESVLHDIEKGVHNDILDGYWQLHQKISIPRRNNIPASENLIKLLHKNGDLFSINLAVDIYNLISTETAIALGAHDIDKITGNIRLDFIKGNEKFVPIGQVEPKSLRSEEYAYVDDADDVICKLEVRQAEKTKVTDQTKNIFYIVQGNEVTTHEELIDTANKIIDETTKYCGGHGKIIFDSEA